MAHWIDLRTGYRCNNRCRFCSQGDLRDARPEATADQILDALAALPALRGAEGVWLAGGEITLRPDLPDLIRAVRQAARAAGIPRLGIQTNGRVLAAPLAAAGLKAAGLTDVAISLHGPEPLHDFLTQERDSFRHALLGARRCQQAGLRLQIHTVLTRSLLPSLPDLVRISRALRPHLHRFYVARMRGSAQNNWEMLIPRFGLLQEPLLEALRALMADGIAAETAGVPLCLLEGLRAAAADRADAPDGLQHAPRLLPLGAEPQAATAHGPPCRSCALRAACSGPEVAYTDEYGWDELLSVASAPAAAPAAAPPALPPPTLPPAPPPRAGRPPATAPRYARAWSGGDPVPGQAPAPPEILHMDVSALESSRRLRRRLIRAAGEGAGTLILTGPDPWGHPDLPEIVREAARLPFRRVEVHGPIQPLAALTPATAQRLSGLSAVRCAAPADPADDADPAVLAIRQLRALLPGCGIHLLSAPPEAP